MLNFASKLFLKLIGGSRNDRLVRAKLKYIRERVNPLEEKMRGLPDEEFPKITERLRERLDQGQSPASVRAEAFAAVREASRRARKHRHFDVQLVAGMVLDEGVIAEEATGEGKTIACYPAIYMAALQGMHTHVVTTNDYLVKVGAEFAQPIFELLGLTVGYITSDMPAYGAEAEIRRRAYACDVTYGMNSEFGFDFLRDNMKSSAVDQVQGELGFAIIDEVDSILIDEARTPLIISGPAHSQTDLYRKADSIARELVRRNRNYDQAQEKVQTLERQWKALQGEVSNASGEKKQKLQKELEDVEDQLVRAEEARDKLPKYYEIELDKKSVHLTHEGIGAAQEIAGVGSFYVGANMEWPHLMEQAMRAHLVFEKDKEYVVQDGRIVIVDEFTGRLLEGRQWSDGLHQAVEAKENVKVKEETQTLATVTLQNYFKMYRKLAGMTGTALTEATEFMKIYGLDVVAVPTHRPVNRIDHDDRIYAEVDGKYNSIVEEINRESKKGRPVLVGTTSIEKSEKISNMLTRRYGVDHQVLNGRLENAVRESEIVLNAGQQHPRKKDSKEMVGVVTIATNMAGRGTDIKLGEGVVFGNCKVPSDEKIRELGLEPDPLYPAGVNKCCMNCEQYDPSTNCSHCFKPKIDSDFPQRGRNECPDDVPCGLHVVGTERHEARRIDNQLRGRSGRQGDPGSSRFFLSLRDELMAMFAGQWTLKVLGWLGLQGDQAIEDKRISKGVERAQRKVEERNFETRKNLLEYDEVMDYQRRAFYSQRQIILDGEGLETVVRELVHDSVGDAIETYLNPEYRRSSIAEYARQALQVSVDPRQIRGTSPDDVESLERSLKNRAKDDAAATITITLGEYMDPEVDRKNWDLRGLSSWAMSRFSVNISQNQLRKMEPEEIEQELTERALEKIDEIQLPGLSRYLAEEFPAASLADWAMAKFGLAVKTEELKGEPAEIERKLVDAVENLYRQREIEYPVEHALEMTMGAHGPENVYALEMLSSWANRKYGLDTSTEQFQTMRPKQIQQLLLAESEKWQGDGYLEKYLQDVVGQDVSTEKAVEFAAERFDTELDAEETDDEPFETLVAAGRKFFRREMTELERYVLLQIFDSSWKDHLLSMDHLKGGIGLRGYAEQDPKVAYKREGSRLFHEMMEGIRDKVTDMIFKVKLAPETQVSSVYEVTSTVHEQLQGYDHLSQSMEEQAQSTEQTKVQTIKRDMPKVGRNDPCPCGSGKKFKKCCGKDI
ncbi:MAG: preprotein translocase subunit SecA [Phycisphaerae bacterium]